MLSKRYNTVKSDENIDLLIHYLNSYDYVAFDTETTGLNPRKDKVIGMSFSGEEGTAFYLAIYEYKVKHGLIQLVSNESVMKVLEVLATKELLTWNGSFDIRMVKCNYGVDLSSNLIADGQLMKHTIEEDGKMALKDTMVELQEFLRMDMSKAANEEQIELKESIIANGGSATKNNYELYKADLAIISKYANADADFTLRICHYYLDKIREQGLDQFFFEDEVMPLYREVTIPMESIGIRLNMPLIMWANDEISKDIKILEDSIKSSILESEEGKQWVEHTAVTKFPAKNSGNFSQEVVRYFDLPLPINGSDKFSITKKTVASLPESDAKSFLLTGDSSYIQEHVTAISVRIWEKFNNGKISITSKDQLAGVVFDFMNIRPESKTDKGKSQFDDNMIDVLSKKYEVSWARDLSNYNKLNKLKGAYIDRFLNSHENNTTHFYYKQHGTISGRYSSDAQQLPRPKEEGELDEVVLKYNNLIRQFFIAGKGYKFIDSDYESLEPHIFSEVSNEDSLKAIFGKGHDFYSTIAISTESLDEYSADKKADNYLGKINKPVRQKSKIYALGVPYGMLAYALSKTLDVSLEEAQRLIEKYLGAYPNLRKWMEDSVSQAQHFGFVKTKTGRVRHLPKVKELYKIHGHNLMDFRYRKKIEKRYGKKEVLTMYRDYKNGINNARNFQIQGLAASVINRAMIQINRKLKEANIDGQVCATIHDQCIVLVEESRAEEAAKIVEDCMCNTTKLSVKLKAPAEICDNWKDGH